MVSDTNTFFSRLSSPKMLTIIGTHHCTSACDSCCFNCSPAIKTTLSLESMIDIIDCSVKSFPAIKILVLTGGEILSLDIDKVKRVLTHAKSKNLKTRLVTNGFWATSMDKTKHILKLLSDAGLDEINISTGDEHQRFVPVNHVVNIAKCTEQVDNLKVCLIVVEKGVSSIFNKEDMIHELQKDVPDDYYHKTSVIVSPWVALKSKKLEFQEDEIIDIDQVSTMERCSNRACSNLFDSIQISPDGQMLGCCGFAAEYSPLLKLGDFFSNKERLNELYMRNSHDLLKLWLFLDGPLGIFEYFNPGKTLKPGYHQCEICTRLLSNPRYLKEIAQLDNGKVRDIILRLKLKLDIADKLPFQKDGMIA